MLREEETINLRSLTIYVCFFLFGVIYFFYLCIWSQDVAFHGVHGQPQVDFFKFGMEMVQA